jgi:ABC-2 type transport system permease protein
MRGGGEIPAGRGEAPDWFINALENLAVYGNVGISLFVSWSLIARLAGMGFSQEGRSYWLVKAAPVSARQILASKFLVAFLPGVIAGGGFLLGLSLLQSVPVTAFVLSLYVVTFCIAGLAGLNLAFGVTGARFDWDDPRHMVRGATGCLAVLATLIFLVICLVSFFGPGLLADLIGLSVKVGTASGLVLGSVVSLAGAILPLWLAIKRIPRLGED